MVLDRLTKLSREGVLDLWEATQGSGGGSVLEKIQEVLREEEEEKGLKRLQQNGL